MISTDAAVRAVMNSVASDFSDCSPLVAGVSTEWHGAMLMAESFDVVVIGAGPAGENVADRVVKAGLSAVVIESELVGGE